MANSNTPKQQLALLEEEAIRAIQSGRPELAFKAWEKALSIDPNNVRVLMAMGQHAFRSGEFQSARQAMERVVAIDGSDSQQWVNLALSRQKLNDELGEEEAIRGALRTNPSDLLALIMRANLLERQGKTHLAAKAHGAVAANAPGLERLPPSLRPALQHAMVFREKYDREFGAFLDQYLDPTFRKFAGEDLRRFRDSLDITIGRKRRFDPQPAVYYYPNLAPVEFFERADFPWLDAVEAATDDVRAEFLAILDTEQGFTPYLTYPDDVPTFQFAELNNSPRWSAFHIYENGKLVEANAPKCPKTIALLDGCPQPAQAGRTPTAMFSLLKPKTHIPPHTGVTNARLVTHLPLIVPQDCGFRVGNQTRHWEPGRAWVFDDTIEHEAWNNSDKLRVVLIFDIWHPHLTPPERTMITTMAEAISAFCADDQGYGL
jgi:aspartate beta-hydroxylase